MDMDTRKRSRPRSTLAWLTIAATVLLSAGASSAAATSSIEGVWSFGGGQIAVQPGADGTFAGTVVAATTFAECAHPVGQKIWTSITPQADGSYWGFHQWYFEGTCAENPTHGPTAWRVREEPDGAKYLRVCFSSPGTAQPTIPLAAPEANVTYGCVDSALTAPLPTGGAASFVNFQQCVSARRFTIHLAEPSYDPFKSVQVTLKGRTFKTTHKGDYVVAAISLEGLPPGGFTVRISATTVLGLHLSGSRTYHTCAKRPKRHTPARLMATKPRKRR